MVVEQAEPCIKRLLRFVEIAWQLAMLEEKMLPMPKDYSRRSKSTRDVERKQVFRKVHTFRRTSTSLALVLTPNARTTNVTRPACFIRS